MRSLLDHCLALEEIYKQSLCSREISRAQLQELNSLDTIFAQQPQPNRMVKRLLHAIRRGWLTIID